MTYTILPISEDYITGYNIAVDKVAREKKYIAFLEGPPLEKSRAFVYRNLQEDLPHFVAISEGIVVGWCDIIRNDMCPIFAHCGSLGIGVLKEYRGSGIGNALIHAALEKARTIGLKRVELTVREENKRALKLYNKFGFVLEGLKRNAILMNNEYENLILMGLIL